MPYGVAPFGNPRIKSCLPIPGAYRSLPRPSSPYDAKASVMRPYTLDRKIRVAFLRAKTFIKVLKNFRFGILDFRFQNHANQITFDVLYTYNLLALRCFFALQFSSSETIRFSKNCTHRENGNSILCGKMFAEKLRFFIRHRLHRLTQIRIHWF